MKFNWRVLVAIVVLLGAIVWGVDSLRTRSYNGTNLNFGIGGGPVTVTNPSDEALRVQLVGARTSTFTVSSPDTNITGRSASQGSGRSGTQLLELSLPHGVSEFTVLRGADVKFVAIANTPLTVAVQPLNAGDAQTTLIVAAIAILGSLFYLSSVNGHRWISASRRKEALDRSTAKAAESKNFKRMFGNLTSGK